MFADLIERLHRRQDLSVDEAADAMQEIMAGRAAPAQIAGLLVALSMKGERPSEIVGLAKTMRAPTRSPCRPATGPGSTPAAPAATARRRSTSRRSPPSSSQAAG